MKKSHTNPVITFFLLSGFVAVMFSSCATPPANNAPANHAAMSNISEDSNAKSANKGGYDNCSNVTGAMIEQAILQAIMDDPLLSDADKLTFEIIKKSNNRDIAVRGWLLDDEKYKRVKDIVNGAQCVGKTDFDWFYEYVPPFNNVVRGVSSSSCHPGFHRCNSVCIPDSDTCDAYAPGGVKDPK